MFAPQHLEPDELEYELNRFGVNGYTGTRRNKAKILVDAMAEFQRLGREPEGSPWPLERDLQSARVSLAEVNVALRDPHNSAARDFDGIRGRLRHLQERARRMAGREAELIDIVEFRSHIQTALDELSRQNQSRSRIMNRSHPSIRHRSLSDARGENRTGDDQRLQGPQMRERSLPRISLQAPNEETAHDLLHSTGVAMEIGPRPRSPHRPPSVADVTEEENAHGGGEEEAQEDAFIGRGPVISPIPNNFGQAQSEHRTEQNRDGNRNGTHERQSEPLAIRNPGAPNAGAFPRRTLLEQAVDSARARGFQPPPNLTHPHLADPFFQEADMPWESATTMARINQVRRLLAGAAPAPNRIPIPSQIAGGRQLRRAQINEPLAIPVRTVTTRQPSRDISTDPPRRSHEIRTDAPTVGRPTASHSTVAHTVGVYEDLADGRIDRTYAARARGTQHPLSGRNERMVNATEQEPRRVRYDLDEYENYLPEPEAARQSRPLRAGSDPNLVRRRLSPFASEPERELDNRRRTDYAPNDNSHNEHRQAPHRQLCGRQYDDDYESDLRWAERQYAEEDASGRRQAVRNDWPRPNDNREARRDVRENSRWPHNDGRRISRDPIRRMHGNAYNDEWPNGQEQEHDRHRGTSHWGRLDMPREIPGRRSRSHEDFQAYDVYDRAYDRSRPLHVAQHQPDAFRQRRREEYDEPWNGRIADDEWALYEDQRYDGPHDQRRPLEFGYHRRAIPVNKWRILFSGQTNRERNELSIHEFLAQINMFRHSEGIQEAELLRQVIHLLRGDALAWYETVYYTIYTWREFVMALKRKFLPHDYSFSLLDEIARRYQGQSEAVGLYINDMERKFRAMPKPMDEAHRVFMIRKNLLPSYREAIAASRTSTVTQLEEVCRLVEGTLLASRRPNNSFGQHGRGMPDRRPRQYVAELASDASEGSDPSESGDEADVYAVEKRIYKEKGKIKSRKDTEKRNNAYAKFMETAQCFNCSEKGHGWKECTKARERHFCFVCGAKDQRAKDGHECKAPKNGPTGSDNKSEPSAKST